MKWMEALKLWNQQKSKGMWCVPKKGSEDYLQVRAIMDHAKPANIKKANEERAKTSIEQLRAATAHMRPGVRKDASPERAPSPRRVPEPVEEPKPKRKYTKKPKADEPAMGGAGAEAPVVPKVVKYKKSEEQQKYEEKYGARNEKQRAELNEHLRKDYPQLFRYPGSNTIPSDVPGLYASASGKPDADVRLILYYLPKDHHYDNSPDSNGKITAYLVKQFKEGRSTAVKQKIHWEMKEITLPNGSKQIIIHNNIAEAKAGIKPQGLGKQHD